MKPWGIVASGALVALVLPLAGCSTLPVACERYDEVLEGINSRIDNGYELNDAFMQDFLAGMSIETLEQALVQRDRVVEAVEQLKDKARELADECERNTPYWRYP
jgi:hypothetical protein